MDEHRDQASSELRSFGRRRGRKLSARQSHLMTIVGPSVRPDLSAPPPESAAALFAVPVSQVWLEIGFGGGEHLAWQARHHPDVGIIGCEPFEDGVVKVLALIDEDEDIHLTTDRVRCSDHLQDARDDAEWCVAARKLLPKLCGLLFEKVGRRAKATPVPPGSGEGTPSC